MKPCIRRAAAQPSGRARLESIRRIYRHLSIRPRIDFSRGAWSDIQKPLYVLTGTHDTGLEGKWEWRTEPFADLSVGCHWLGVIDGATHLNFAGIGMAGTTKRLTLQSVAAFLAGARSGHCVAPKLGKEISLQSKFE